MYDKKNLSVTSHALYPLPLSQAVTLSRTSPRAWRTLWTAPNKQLNKKFVLFGTNSPWDESSGDETSAYRHKYLPQSK